MQWTTEQIEARLAAMAESMANLSPSPSCMVGIASGGAWVAEALNARLPKPLPLGHLNAAFYRDDFHARGLKARVEPSRLPFSVDDQHVILVDDVLMTGRTVRAAMNELFDYGRPASITLAVIFDVGRRELPVQANVCGEVLQLDAGQRMRFEGPAPLRAAVVSAPERHSAEEGGG